MDKGSIQESGSHDELMNIEVKKGASGDMITGWYRDLYETQHGKSEGSNDAEMLRAELASLRQELEVMREENIQLKGDKIKTGRGMAMRHVLEELPPQLNLIRHVSEGGPVNGHDEDVPPMPLELRYGKTM